jgi:hypothetical protein
MAGDGDASESESEPRNEENQFWIGLHDQNVEGQYEWVNNYPVTYESWGPNEPNGATNKNCVAIGFFGDTTWDVRKCN